MTCILTSCSNWNIYLCIFYKFCILDPGFYCYLASSHPMWINCRNSSHNHKQLCFVNCWKKMILLNRLLHCCICGACTYTRYSATEFRWKLWLISTMKVHKQLAIACTCTTPCMGGRDTGSPHVAIATSPEKWVDFEHSLRTSPAVLSMWPCENIFHIQG